MDLFWTRVRFPPSPPYRKNMFKFNWFKKKEVPSEEPTATFDFEDNLEIALWDIKEKYDLETEEVEKTVFEKRNNLQYMRKFIKNGHKKIK